MSVTSGFFNSLNGDRKYNAEQMSALFNGIINDGVFANIGTAFGIKASGDSLDVTVGVGRAWFNGAWVYNDAILALTAEASEMVLNRYDAVVIEINHTDAVRSGSIKIVKGTPASTASYPQMVHSDRVHQYPLAYIYRAAGTEVITQANITNRIGTSDCPYITGILQVVNIDNIVAQWQDEWETWSSQWPQWEAMWDQWFEAQTANVDEETANWMSQMKSNFDIWFNSLQVILDGDVATNLANSVVELQNRFLTLAEERAVYEPIQDSSDDGLLDSSGNSIEGRTVLGGSSGGSADLGDITPDKIGAAKAVHAQQHSTDGIDPITPEMIGAAKHPKLQIITLPTTGWLTSGIVQQTINVPGVLADATKQKITVAPEPGDMTVYREYGVYCDNQLDGRLHFVADKAVFRDINVYVTIEEVDYS